MTDNTQQDLPSNVTDATRPEDAAPASEAIEAQEQPATTVVPATVDAAFDDVNQALAAIQAALTDDPESPLAAADDGWVESPESCEQAPGVADGEPAENSAEQQPSDPIESTVDQAETEAQASDVVDAVESTLEQVDEHLAAIESAVDGPSPADTEAAIADAADSLETEDVPVGAAASQADISPSPEVALEADAVVAADAVEISVEQPCEVVAEEAADLPVEAVAEIGISDIEADAPAPATVDTLERETVAETAAEPFVDASETQAEVVTKDQTPAPRRDVAAPDAVPAEADAQSQAAAVAEVADPPGVSPEEADAIIAQATTLTQDAPADAVPAESVAVPTAPAAEPDGATAPDAAIPGADEAPAGEAAPTAEVTPSVADQPADSSAGADAPKPADGVSGQPATPPSSPVHAVLAPAVIVLVLLDKPFSFLSPSIKGVLGYIAIATTLIAAAAWLVLPRLVIPQ